MKQAPTLVATVTLGALLAAGCTLTRTVRSSGLVPRAQPALHSGQPLSTHQRTLGLTLGTGNLVSSARPAVAADADVGGIVVPEIEIQGGFRAQITPLWSAGLLYDQGHAETATRANPGHPPAGGRDLIGMGYSIEATPAIPGVPGLRIGISIETWLYSIPFRDYENCVDRCWTTSAEPRVKPEAEHELIPVLSGGLRPSYKRGPVAIFGVLEARTQPTIAPARFDAEPEEAPQFGNFVGMVGGGAELELPRGVRLLAQIYQPLGHSPIDYGTSVAASLLVPVYFEPFPAPRERQRRRPAAPVAPVAPVTPVAPGPVAPGTSPYYPPAPWSTPPR